MITAVISSQWTNERIPKLVDVLWTVPRDKGIFIEKKCGSEITLLLQETLEQSTLSLHQIKLFGFDEAAMTDIKRQLSQYEVFLIFDIKRVLKTHSFTPSVNQMISKAIAISADGIDMFACEAITKEFVDQVKTAGLKLYLWTVNNPEEESKFIEAGVDGITSDRPYWLKNELQRSLS